MLQRAGRIGATNQSTWNHRGQGHRRGRCSVRGDEHIRAHNTLFAESNEVRVFYPFHPLHGSTLQIVRRPKRGDGAVSVIDRGGKRLKIPVWMLMPDSTLSHPRSVGESQRDCLYSIVEFRSRRTHGHPGMSQHGRTWRTDRGSCSCDHRRRPNRARAIKAASGVSVTPERTPFTLMGSRRSVEAAGLLIQRSFYQKQGVLGIAPRTVGNANAAGSRNAIRRILLAEWQSTWPYSPLVDNLERLLASGTPFDYWRLIWCLVEKGLPANRMTKCQAGKEVHFIRAYETVHA